MSFPFADIAPAGQRVWVPDILAWCWCELSERGAWRSVYARVRPSDGDLCLLDPEGTTWRDLARAEDGWAPPQLLDAVRLSTETEDSFHRAVQLLKLLVALDRAGDGIGFERRGFHPAAQPILDRWEDNDGKLQRLAPVLVLRKAAAGYTGGASLGQYLHNYVVCDAPRLRIKIHKLSEYGSFDDLRGRPIRVAFVPVLRNESDARFVPGRRRGRFLVELDDESQGRLTETASRLVEALESEGVNVAVLPEGCARQPFLAALQAALSAKTQVANQSLRLVVVGVGPSLGEPVVCSNLVRVFDGKGTRLFDQKKIHPWHLDASQLQRYGLCGRWATDDADLVEDMDLEAPATLHLIEGHGLGRLTILICEDLARADIARGLVVESGPTLVIGPVMDDSLEPTCWAFHAAQQLSRNEPQAIALVANSCWLPQVAGSRGRRGGATLAPGIGIVSEPHRGRIVRMDTSATFKVEDIDMSGALPLARTL